MMENLKFFAGLIVGIILTVLFLIFVIFVYTNGDIHAYKYFNSEDLGTLGDFTGGILNPFIGMITIFLLFKAYTLQKSEFFKLHNASTRQNELADNLQKIEQTYKLLDYEEKDLNSIQVMFNKLIKDGNQNQHKVRAKKLEIDLAYLRIIKLYMNLVILQPTETPSDPTFGLHTTFTNKMIRTLTEMGFSESHPDKIGGILIKKLQQISESIISDIDKREIRNLIDQIYLAAVLDSAD